MICFDTGAIIRAVQYGADGAKAPSPKVRKESERIQRYLRHLAETKETVIIPAPALQEYLVGREGSLWDGDVAVIRENFYIEDLDLPSAMLAAELERAAFADEKRKDGEKQESRVDAQILAIALTRGATTIISYNTKHLVPLSRGREIQVIEPPDIPEQPDMLHQVEGSDQCPTERA